MTETLEPENFPAQCTDRVMGVQGSGWDSAGNSSEKKKKNSRNYFFMDYGGSAMFKQKKDLPQTAHTELETHVV